CATRADSVGYAVYMPSSASNALSVSLCFFFFKQKTAYEMGQALPHLEPGDLDRLHGLGHPPTLCCSVARMNPWNRGWGRRGRELNSGWNCVATNQGWCGSSMISTSRPSGDSPLSTNPCLVSRSRYALLNSYRCRWRSMISVRPYASWAREPFSSMQG